MKLLLDTHALLWWMTDDVRLEERARAGIADPGNAVLVSAVSLWEIALKVRIGKLDADVGEILRAIEPEVFIPLGIDPPHLLALGRLPQHPEHRDPFDHLLIAQAIAEGAIFVTADQAAQRYPVQVMPCSDART